MLSSIIRLHSGKKVTRSGDLFYVIEYPEKLSTYEPSLLP